MSQNANSDPQVYSAPPVIQDRHLQELLRESLARLADTLDTVAGQNSDELPISEWPQETTHTDAPEVTRLGFQSSAIAKDFAQATKELGPTAAEDDVWRKVSSIQLLRLYANQKDPVVTQDTATTWLTTNLLATYGLPKETAEATIRGRMWAAALFHSGGAILEAAQVNRDLCVMTNSTSQPFQSISEQVQPYANLLRLTDHNSDELRSSSAVVAELANATLQQAAILFSLALQEGNVNFCHVNLATIPPEHVSQLAQALIVDGHTPLSQVRRVGLPQEISENQAIEWSRRLAAIHFDVLR